MTHRPLALTILSCLGPCCATSRRGPATECRAAAPVATPGQRSGGQPGPGLRQSWSAAGWCWCRWAMACTCAARSAGLVPGSRHGFHIHEKPGDCSARRQQRRRPLQPHGPAARRAGQGAHHAGDADNLVADAKGVARVDAPPGRPQPGNGAHANDVAGRAVIGARRRRRLTAASRPAMRRAGGLRVIQSPAERASAQAVVPAVGAVHEVDVDAVRAEHRGELPLARLEQREAAFEPGGYRLPPARCAHARPPGPSARCAPRHRRNAPAVPRAVQPRFGIGLEQGPPAASTTARGRRSRTATQSSPAGRAGSAGGRARCWRPGHPAAPAPARHRTGHAANQQLGLQHRRHRFDVFAPQHERQHRRPPPASAGSVCKGNGTSPAASRAEADRAAPRPRPGARCSSSSTRRCNGPARAQRLGRIEMRAEQGQVASRRRRRQRDQVAAEQFGDVARARTASAASRGELPSRAVPAR